jgi:hypothetical protein
VNVSSYSNSSVAQPTGGLAPDDTENKDITTTAVEIVISDPETTKDTNAEARSMLSEVCKTCAYASSVRKGPLVVSFVDLNSVAD